MNFDMTIEDIREPLPVFTLASAKLKVQKAEDAWNLQDPKKVATAYSLDSVWRNRDSFLTGREAIVDFLTEKWEKEQQYRLIKELWAYTDDRIAVRFAYEWQNKQGEWFRAYGNENWLFNTKGLMVERHASINDLEITAAQRKFDWPLGKKPENYATLSELNL